MAGDVPLLGFHDGEKRHGPTPDLGPEPSGSLQELGMDIEDVPGIGLASRRALQEEGDLTMDPGVLGQVVEHHQHVAPVTHEVLAERTGGVGDEELLPRGTCGRRRRDDGVLHRPAFLQELDDLGQRGFAASHTAIDTDDVLAPLVQDGIDGQDRLAGHPVSHDQLALALGDGNDRIDDLGPRVQLVRKADPLHHARGDAKGLVQLCCLHLAPSIARVPQGIDDPAHEPLTDRNLKRLGLADDFVAGLELGLVAQHQGHHLLLVEADDHARQIVGEMDHLSVEAERKPNDGGDGLLDLDDRPDLAGLEGLGSELIERDFLEHRPAFPSPWF